MTGAIEFLQHARKCCAKHLGCLSHGEPCPAYRYWKQHNVGECRFKNLYLQDDNDIADLVREVERWWRENE